MDTDPESERLRSARAGTAAWRRWGPYLSERQWGTVREDYSDSGDAWNYFTHDQARSRAYRWGEDGLAGLSDDRQRLCVALALWNGADPILKERLFGLTNGEGNHGEDVKEYYFYLDSTPTHSYLKYLYKYPQRAFPYDDLVRTNAARRRDELEYELLDTGVFDEDRYFDVFVEYAKASPEDILIQITVVQPRTATPRRSTCCRRSGSATPGQRRTATTAPDAAPGRHGLGRAASSAPIMPSSASASSTARMRSSCCSRRTRRIRERIANTPNRTPYVKDGINEYIVHGRREAVNPQRGGTKAAAHYSIDGRRRAVARHAPATERSSASAVRCSARRTVRRGLRRGARGSPSRGRRVLCGVIPACLGADAANVFARRSRACCGRSSSTTTTSGRWLEHGADRGGSPRNRQWRHMHNADIISMPDKWEYPWYAAWDLAFHILALTLVDEDFGKAQLDLMLQSTYLHPNGQLPAYEWNFGDVNPPVHAWSTIYTYRLEAARHGHGDIDWLERSFHTLLLNFTWWVNRKDRGGKNVFEGGFLGLDNIGVFDRSSPLPTAAISSRRTARRGWRCSARTCSRSPSSSRCTGRRTCECARSSSSTSCGSPRR